MSDDSRLTELDRPGVHVESPLAGLPAGALLVHRLRYDAEGVPTLDRLRVNENHPVFAFSDRHQRWEPVVIRRR